MIDISLLLTPSDLSLESIAAHRSAGEVPRRIILSDRNGHLGAPLGQKQQMRLLDDVTARGGSEFVYALRNPLDHRGLLALARQGNRLKFHSTLRTGSFEDPRVLPAIASAEFSSLDLFFGHDIERLVESLRAYKKVVPSVGLYVDLPLANDEIERLLRLGEAESVSRITFAFGPNSTDVDDSRQMLDCLLHRTPDRRPSAPLNIVTVGSPMDAPYAWLTLERERSPLAYRALRYLELADPEFQWSIAEIDLRGNVFLFEYGVILGNIERHSLSSIWQSGFVAKLRARRSKFLKGRCAACRFLQFCGGGSITRTYVATGDLWASDPGCYLSDNEIARV